ncbi:MAG: glycosyltransferase [Pyrinomonadaceae bacterium]
MKILWLKTELLHPVDKGGRIRTYQMLRELKKDHEITYLSLDGETGARDAGKLASEYCHHLVTVHHPQSEKFSLEFYVQLVANIASPFPYAISKYRSSEMRREIKSNVVSANTDLLVCDFLAPAINVPLELDCATLLFQHNVEAMIWKRHFEVQKNLPKKLYLWHQWQKMRQFELDSCNRFDAVVSVSRDDKDRITNDYGVADVFDVPTGVDIDYFSPAAPSSTARNNLVFTGSMDWLPNSDAITFFVEDILPLIRKVVPDVTLTVVGRNPSSSLQGLARQNTSITVTGRVEDVRPFIKAAAVYIVPIRIGGGTRLKIYEAMAMGRPVVSTFVGAEGLPLQANSEILLADDPDDFASAVIGLLQDPARAQQMAGNAAAKIRPTFSWAHAAHQFSKICENTVERRKTRDKK